MHLIRAAEIRDLSEIAAMFDQYRQFYEQTSNSELAKEYISARIKNNESVIFVAENTHQQLLGFCQMYPSFCSVEAAPIYVLYDLFVLPSARRQGVAQALLKTAASYGKSQQKVRLDLTTAKDNLQAQALYESLGWQRDTVFYTYTLPLTPV